MAQASAANILIFIFFEVIPGDLYHGRDEIRLASLPPLPLSAMLNPCAQKNHVTAIRINFAHWGEGGKTRSVLKFRRGRYCKTVFGQIFLQSALGSRRNPQDHNG